MAFQWEAIGSFGGGLDFTKHPAALRSDQWSWSDGWLARDGCAETANGLTLLASLSGLTIDQQIIGLVQRVWGQDGAVVGAVDVSTNTGRLFTVNGQGAVTELTKAGGGDPVYGNTSAVLQGCFLGGGQVLNFGWHAVPGSGSNNITSLAGWGGGATYGLIGPLPGTTAWHYFAGFQAHMVGGMGQFAGVVGFNEEGQRLVGWGTSNVGASFDTPAVANDADYVILDDIGSGVCGLVPAGANLCAIFTRSSIHALVPTGGIPAFQRQLVVEGLGMFNVRNTDPTAGAFRSQSFWGRSPAGVAFAAQDDLYLLGPGGMQPVGTPIWRYWSQGLSQSSTSCDPVVPYHQTFVWHEGLGMLFCPRPHLAVNNLSREVLVLDPLTQSWSRLQYAAPATSHYMRSAYIYSYSNPGALQRELWVATKNAVYKEGTDPIAGGVVDTKDFAFGSPPVQARINAIKVDWEPRTNATTDAITVWAAARNELSRGVLGTEGEDTQPTFTQIGTLTGGASELPCRLKAKYVRFRFKQSSGHARIRGFHVSYEPASDVPRTGGVPA